MATGKVYAEVENLVDAVARTRGPRHRSPVRLEFHLQKLFGRHLGGDICTSTLSSQSDCETFEEKLQNGSFEADGLALVISVEEEKSQKASKLEQSSTQMGLQLDATLTIQMKKRFLSSKLDVPEALRTKYKVMGNLWLLADVAAESEDVSRHNRNV